MKKYLTIWIFLLLPLAASAQLSQVLSPEMWQSIINPANCGSSKMFKFGLDVQTNFKGSLQSNSNWLYGEIPACNIERFSFGFSLYATKSALSGRKLLASEYMPTLKLSYATDLSKYDHLRWGIEARYMLQSVDWENLVFAYQLDPFYGQVIGGSNNPEIFGINKPMTHQMSAMVGMSYRRFLKYFTKKNYSELKFDVSALLPIKEDHWIANSDPNTKNWGVNSYLEYKQPFLRDGEVNTWLSLFSQFQFLNQIQQWTAGTFMQSRYFNAGLGLQLQSHPQAMGKVMSRAYVHFGVNLTPADQLRPAYRIDLHYGLPFVRSFGFASTFSISVIAKFHNRCTAAMLGCPAN